MKRSLAAIVLAVILPMVAFATPTTISGTQVNYPVSFPLQTGQWCFNGACATITNGAFSGSFTEGTATVTITTGAQTILTVPGVTISTSTYDWDNYVAPAGSTLSGMGTPTIPCAIGAAFQQNDSLPPYQGWGCKTVAGATAWIAQGTPATQIVLNLPVNAITTTTTVSTAAPGNVRSIIGQVTTTNTGYANGGNSLVGIRGVATLPSGTTATNGYVYGAQGKLIVQGTVNGGALWMFGLLGQLDLSSATLTGAAHIAPIWSDAGATAPSGACAFCDSMVITNTTAATFNSLIYGYSKATRLMDLTDNGGGYIIPGSGASAAVSGYLKIKVSGTDVYLRYYAGAS
jgi:hypothetical protein